MEDLFKNNKQWSLDEDLEKSTDPKIRTDVKAANEKLKSLGVKDGSYGLTSKGTPHWSYSYHKKHQDKIEAIHRKHIQPHMPDGSTWEDYADEGSMRQTYGGHPEHCNTDADAGYKLNTSKKLRSPEKFKKSDLIKSLENSGHRESALLLKNWDEMDAIATEMLEKSASAKDTESHPIPGTPYHAVKDDQYKGEGIKIKLTQAGKHVGHVHYTEGSVNAARYPKDSEEHISKINKHIDHLIQTDKIK